MYQAAAEMENANYTYPIDSDIIPVTDIADPAFDTYLGIVGKSDCMRDIFRIVDKIADSDTTVLISGETGTGKGLLTQSIHEKSYRREKPFIKINCGAIPDHLLESELFGHEKGAFTGATNAKPGKFELADGGTIFLDEIGDMSYDLQVKVLRVLDEGEFERVGGCKTLKTDVRIIAATHRDLKEEVKKGNFREDLFYRLYIIPVYIPALKDRKSDIPLLISYFLRANNRKKKGAIAGISKNAMQLLSGYAWPGNIRELKNVIERIVVLNDTGFIQSDDCPGYIKDQVQDWSPEVEVLPVELSEDGIC
jgi:transcriptional regulator with GAF, ATPase, and Fis domain